MNAATPTCRYCRSPVIRGVPCSCDRGQEEARRIAGGHDGDADAPKLSGEGSMMEKVKASVTIPREVYDFLMGEGPLDGTWFGELAGGRLGKFWWRAILKTATRHPPAPLVSDEILSDIAYNAEQIANYIAIPNPSEKHLVSARWHNNKIRAALQALSPSEKEISDAAG